MLSDYEIFKQKIRRKADIDLSCYKPRQMERRIRTLMERANCKDLAEYYWLLKKNSQEYQNFLDYVTINFSEFFRDPKRFKELREKVLSQLSSKARRARIWSAGCASGEEPYTLAIILEEIYSQNEVVVLATDIDEGALNKAKFGVYGSQHLRNLDSVQISRYFIKKGDPLGLDQYLIKEEIKRKVKFEKRDLLHDEFEKSYFDLILCRNVIIYFQDEVKVQLIGKFYQALRRGGVLFLGSTESIPDIEKIGFKNIGLFLHQKES